MTQKLKISIKLRVFSNRLFVSSHRGVGGVDGEEGAGVRNSGGGVGGQKREARWGGNSGGVNSGGCSTSKNRLSHHKYVSKTV